MGLKAAIGLIVYGTYCWDGQFNSQRRCLGVSAEFPHEKWSTPKKLSTYPSTCLPACLPACLPTYLPTYIYIFLVKKI